MREKVKKKNENVKENNQTEVLAMHISLVACEYVAFCLVTTNKTSVPLSIKGK